MLALIRALLSVAGTLSEWAARRQLLQAGEAQAIVRSIRDADVAIQRAHAARAAVDHSDDGVRNDPDNRDRDV